MLYKPASTARRRPMVQRVEILLTDDLDGSKIPKGKGETVPSHSTARRTKSTFAPGTRQPCGRHSGPMSLPAGRSRTDAAGGSPEPQLMRILAPSRNGLGRTGRKSRTADGSRPTSGRHSTPPTRHPRSGSLIGRATVSQHSRISLSTPAVRRLARKAAARRRTPSHCCLTVPQTVGRYGTVGLYVAVESG
jgi:hypothetical protein